MQSFDPFSRQGHRRAARRRAPAAEEKQTGQVLPPGPIRRGRGRRDRGRAEMNNTLLRRQEGAAFSAGDKKGRPSRSLLCITAA